MIAVSSFVTGPAVAFLAKVADFADLALSEPLEALKQIGPRLEYVAGDWIMEASDKLEAGARAYLQNGDTAAFSAVIDAVAMSARFKEAILREWTGEYAPPTPLILRHRARTSRPSRADLPRHTAEEIKAGLRCGRSGCSCSRARVHCPSHDDRGPSLEVSDRRGKTLVRCWAGCTQDAVITGLRAKGLWP